MVLRPARFDLGEGITRSKHMVIRCKEQRQFLAFLCMLRKLYFYIFHKDTPAIISYTECALSNSAGQGHLELPQDGTACHPIVWFINVNLVALKIIEVMYIFSCLFPYYLIK